MSELSSVRYVSIRSAAERVSETTTVPSATSSPMNAVAKMTETTATESPRGSLQPLEIPHERVERERDHGGRQEEEEDVPERPREEERRGAAATGSTTSWIQRGIRIGGGPELISLTPRS